ncbi:hypothetical protein [uncultured Prevotella sp.]|uniref:hypothetical protein n=1 Tax=uncultured Prevotella sp. TaxID=159272 RepID=UPI00258C8847|nr:hypothetical protein [uncultured Prevotella sp.]
MKQRILMDDIVPANDVLQDEMENIRGGSDFTICLSGCSEGGKNPKPNGDQPVPIGSTGSGH